MKIKITQPQTCDMGSGFGYIEGSHGNSLEEVLNWIEYNTRTWGVVTIYNSGGNIIRKFDYDLYRSNIFFHYLAQWYCETPIEKVHFDYCFMYRNFDIYLQ